MRAIRYVLCDFFTDRPLAGNQLAVFTDARSAARHAFGRQAHRPCINVGEEISEDSSKIAKKLKVKPGEVDEMT